MAHCSFWALHHMYFFATLRKAPIMGKWAVSESVWPDQTYEDHCNGWLWITTSEVRTIIMMATRLRNNEECINENLRGMAKLMCLPKGGSWSCCSCKSFAKSSSKWIFNTGARVRNNLDVYFFGNSKYVLVSIFLMISSPALSQKGIVL